jgi:hypothetical protein
MNFFHRFHDCLFRIFKRISKIFLDLINHYSKIIGLLHMLIYKNQLLFYIKKIKKWNLKLRKILFTWVLQKLNSYKSKKIHVGPLWGNYKIMIKEFKERNSPCSWIARLDIIELSVVLNLYIQRNYNNNSGKLIVDINKIFWCLSGKKSRTDNTILKEKKNAGELIEPDFKTY